MGEGTRRSGETSVSAGFSGGLALAFLWALTSTSMRFRFPATALSERLIRLAPGGVATFFIDKLQHNAMRLLVAIITVAFLALAGFLPRMVRRAARGERVLASVVFGSALAFSTATDPTGNALSVVVNGLVGGTIYGLALHWLGGVIEPAGSREGSVISRRQALTLLGAGAVTIAALGTAVGRALSRLAGPNTRVALRPPDELAVVPKGPGRNTFPSVPGLSPEITSVADHYVVDIDVVDPLIEAASWRLVVDGLVRRPLSLTLQDLQTRYRVVEEYAVLTCISNFVGGNLIGNSKWTGVRLGDVLHDAGIQAEALDVVFRCADGYHSSLPAQAARDPSVLLAFAQNGEPLTWHHGFPCRVRAPAFYGVKNAKWLTRIEVVGTDHQDFWTERGWSEMARVRTESRIDTQGPFMAHQEAWIAGVAWAGDHGISKVEVSADDGATWSPAILKPPISMWAWTQWAWRWDRPSVGTYRLRCRATDGTGVLQDRIERPPHPSGASGYEEIEVRVN